MQLDCTFAVVRYQLPSSNVQNRYTTTASESRTHPHTIYYPSVMKVPACTRTTVEAAARLKSRHCATRRTSTSPARDYGATFSQTTNTATKRPIHDSSRFEVANYGGLTTSNVVENTTSVLSAACMCIQNAVTCANSSIVLAYATSAGP